MYNMRRTHVDFGGNGTFFLRKLPFYFVGTIPQMLNRRYITLVTDGFVK